MWTPTKMPVMSSPLGDECNKGPAGAIWKTDDIAAELIAIALETHVKYVHQNVAAAPAPATLAAKELIRPKVRVQVHDGRRGLGIFCSSLDYVQITIKFKALSGRH